MVIWRGEWYRRKRSATWRNRRTGAVTTAPKGGNYKGSSTETTRAHFYGFDKAGRRVVVRARKRK